MTERSKFYACLSSSLAASFWPIAGVFTAKCGQFQQLVSWRRRAQDCGRSRRECFINLRRLLSVGWLFQRGRPRQKIRKLSPISHRPTQLFSKLHWFSQRSDRPSRERNMIDSLLFFRTAVRYFISDFPCHVEECATTQLGFTTNERYIPPALAPRGADVMSVTRDHINWNRGCTLFSDKPLRMGPPR